MSFQEMPDCGNIPHPFWCEAGPEYKYLPKQAAPGRVPIDSEFLPVILREIGSSNLQGD